MQKSYNVSNPHYSTEFKKQDFHKFVVPFPVRPRNSNPIKASATVPVGSRVVAVKIASHQSKGKIYSLKLHIPYIQKSLSTANHFLVKMKEYFIDQFVF